MAKLIYEGKAKQMWSTDDPEVLRVVYMDQATALNGKKRIRSMAKESSIMKFHRLFSSI